MSKMIRLAFLGDVTCDRPMLKAALSDEGYDFKRSLIRLRSLVADADYVIANLETVFGGEKAGYNPYPITYNSPDSLCDGLVAAGINVVTTANNHCLDMGGAGIERTIHILDQYGIKHTGTFSKIDYKNRYLIIEKDGIRVAIVSFTDEINKKEDGSRYSEKEWNQVNCLRPYEYYLEGNRTKIILKKILPMPIINSVRAEYKRLKGIPLVSERKDDQTIPRNYMESIDSAKAIMEQARKECNCVIACIHCGGQFNYEPGEYSKSLYDLLEPYCDVIVGNHPHVVQRMNITGNRIRAYSLGSVNMSPSADYIHQGTDSSYSVILSISVILNDQGAIDLSDISYKVIHAKEDDNHYVIVKEADAADKASIVVKNRFYSADM